MWDDEWSGGWVRGGCNISRECATGEWGYGLEKI